MSDSPLIPVWDPSACIPREEVLTGTLTDAELALRLSSVVWGGAKAPYNDPRTFFEATHMTRGMKNIVEFLFGRLSGARPDVNPITVLDVGFGGGKTHTLVTLYYAAKYPKEPTVREKIGKAVIPSNVKVVTVCGEEWGEKGVRRKNTPVSTIWGDLFYQLGVYDQYKKLDLERAIPSLEDIISALGDYPVLIIIDELPTYLKLAGSSDAKMMDKAVQFIQRLVLAVVQKENAALVIALAEDAYKSEAKLARDSITDAAKRAMDDARAHIRRSEIVIAPADESDAVHIIQKRLFTKINAKIAANVSDAYHDLYTNGNVPDAMKKIEYRDEIQKCYPFHPELIAVLYERLATLDQFNRTRGALRLLNRVVRRVWSEKEDDAFLIHPYHVDLADEGIVNELTEKIDEGRRRNAIEADIWRTGGGATAQDLDEEVASQWKAPLHRRTTNIIYLYSLATGREGDHGIGSDELVALMLTPSRPDFALRVRDSVFRKFQEEFHYIDRRGTHYLFILEPSPLRVIDKEAKNMGDQEVTTIIKETISSLFSDKPDWIHVEIFPTDPSKLEDQDVIKLAILNPNLHHVIPDSGDIPDSVSLFMTHTDVQGKRFRSFRNDTFLLVAEESRIPPMRSTAQKLASARTIRKDLARYGIPNDKKSDVEEYLSTQEKYINDYVRSAFCKFIYYDKKGEIKPISMNPNGYSGGRKGKEMFSYHLKDVFRRVIDTTLDPGYIDTDVWIKDSPYLNSKTLYELFHKKPGLVIPTTQKQFKETIIRGIEERYWIIKIQDAVFTSEKLPPQISIDSFTEIWRREEAEKTEWFKPKEPVQPPISTAKGSTKKTIKHEGPTPFVYSIDEEPAASVAEDLEKYAKREKIKQLQNITLKCRRDPTVINEINNILTRVKSEKECEINLIMAIENYSAPKFSISINGWSKNDLQDPTVKLLLESISRLKNIEEFNLALTLTWQDVAVDRIAQLIRTISQTNNDSLFTLEIQGIKGA